jgi:hypothetical protein
MPPTGANSTLLGFCLRGGFGRAIATGAGSAESRTRGRARGVQLALNSFQQTLGTDRLPANSPVLA